MSSARRRVKRAMPVIKKPASASPAPSRLPRKWLAGSAALLLLIVFALAWKFTSAHSALVSTSSASTAPIALASLSDAPTETSLLTPRLPLVTPANAPVPGAVKNNLPSSVPAQMGEPGAKLRRVVDKKIANGMVTLTLKDEQTGRLSVMTQPLGTNVSTVEAGGEEKVVASAPVVKAADPAQDALTTQGIETIKSGMTVPTRNPITGKTEFKKVVRTFKHLVYEIVKLDLADGSTGKVVDSLRGTPQHPFFTPTGMIAMGDLKPEMKVITRRGPPLVVKSVTRESHPEGIPVYNFEVEGDHTYFVGKAQGGTWVHNNCDDVIAETLAGRGNITSAHTLTSGEAMEAAEQFLGPGYREIGNPGSGVYRSADGLRQFRMDPNSLLGNHAPSVPHVHFEVYPPGGRFPVVNNHVPFTD